MAAFPKTISFYDRLPHAFEMLYVPAWRIGGSSAAKLVHFAFLLTSTALIVRIADRLALPRMAGPIAAALYFCTPIVAVAGTSAFNDAALVYFSLAAVLLAMEDKPVYAGLIAGFCYAVKMTGLIAVPVTLAFFVWRRQWRSTAICGTAAAVILCPWVIRNCVQTGNPLAPFFNTWFPNPYFYAITEHTLTESLRNYGVSFWQRFPELLTGSRLQGVIGPAFALAPLGLLAARRRSGLLLVALAAAFSLPVVDERGRPFSDACDSVCGACRLLGCPLSSSSGYIASARNHLLAERRSFVLAPSSTVEGLPASGGSPPGNRGAIRKSDIAGIPLREDGGGAYARRRRASSI